MKTKKILKRVLKDANKTDIIFLKRIKKLQKENKKLRKLLNEGAPVQCWKCGEEL